MTVSCSAGLGRLARTMLGLVVKRLNSVNCTEDSCSCMSMCMCVCVRERVYVSVCECMSV